MAAHTTHTMSNGTLSKLVDHMCSHEGGNSVIQAIKLVREVTGVGLKEANDFVKAVQAMKGKCYTAKNQLKLVNILGLDESDYTPRGPRAKAPSTATELPEAIQKTQAGFDLAAFYSNFMKTHTYREWEEFLGALAQGKSKL